MFRRKTRNAPAYTGVGHSGPSAQQPNNNAMAAALTIGQNLKQTQPAVYGAPDAPVSRAPQKPKHTSSLLKRNSSFQGSIPATSTPRQSRTNSTLSKRHSITNTPNVREFHIDDSFSDASFDQMGMDADTHYSNAARVSDLKLHHEPPKQKMVKKYIPTPNGIQVVEVPAETMKNDIARSNSMRLGMSLGRTGLFQNGSRSNSLMRPKKTTRKPALRLSSIVSQPRIDENTVLESPKPQKAHNDLLHQIEHEKQLARDLEAQREEFLKLKELRLKNERKMRELKVLQEEEALLKESSPVESKIPELTNELTTKFPVEHETFGASVVADDDEEEVPVAPVPFVVDEMELMQLNGARKDSVLSTDLVEPDIISSSSKNSLNNVPISTSPHDALINNYGDTFIPFEESINPEVEPDFGIEEIPKKYFDSPEAKTADLPEPELPTTLAPPEILHETPSPSFDPVPEIIDDLVPPVNIAGSIRSFSSVDSKSKPIKSAMKSSKSKYSTTSATESPANKAYLSLTTAENTRLNSKLSSSQLQEFHAQQELKAQNLRNQLHAQSPQQGVRKQPSNNGSGLSGRSLRPQSMAEAPAPRGSSGGMSSRTFKTQSTYQPIPSHNFHQSPSKQRAAELYAKANNRPLSEFQPLQRKSSFTRGEGTENPGAAPTRRTHRTTLRAADPFNTSGSPGNSRPDFRSDSRYPAPAAAPANHKEKVPETKTTTHTGGFKSRYADSDDEADVPSNPGFRSRFNDSDDDVFEVRAPGLAPPVIEAPQKSMRTSKPKEKNDKPKEKKPKKKFLKKLFGRD